MFEPLRRLLNQINTPTTAALQGRALLAQIDAEVALMAGALQRADRAPDDADAALAGLRHIARLRLSALREAAIAARAVRPEHIHYSAAAACLSEGANIAPLLARLGGAAELAAQPMARVA